MFNLCILVLSPFDIDRDFITVNYYKSFSSPNECFEIYHNYPTGPRFLIVEMKYKINSKFTNIFKKSITKQYQLKIINETCKSSINLPNIEKSSSIMNMAVTFYVYYTDPISRFIYNFDSIFNVTELIIVSTRNNFGLKIEFSGSINEHSILYKADLPEVISYLLTIPEKYNLLCVITEYNESVVLLSQHKKQKNNYIITAIQVQYIKDQKISLMITYSAFECYQQIERPTKIVFLIYDGYKENIRINIIYRNLNEKSTVAIFSRASFINMRLINVNKMKSLYMNIPKMIFLKTELKYILFPKGTSISKYVYESNNFYYEESSKIVDISNGIRRKKWFYSYSVSPCE